ncbi:Bug family tripartite tricarboxylate transporter substrate binding protein [Zwartia vadi]|uniref:Bug family tripartite tricarboxylate transporter substrate binding protein n=1 Tax=Zwartia vadi TaxID=3058168 RepID=UPI0025B2A2F9|nr:tripartite tricarboxylate transporter substrate binding protein [Zwartia vadi]MDN3987708.1 tripartite tricarboxylate transporter substrate binding protein [Zwartia vadi]
MSSKVIKLFSAMAISASAFLANAQADSSTYPSRTVSIIVPTTPGGTADILGRLIGSKLAEMWGHPVVIENKPGAGTLVGSEYVARAKPDGYTLMVTFNELATLPAINKNARIDVVKDFVRIGKIGNLPVVILGHPRLPQNTLQELIAEIRANPGKYSYSSNGSGGVLQLYTEMFKQEAKIDVLHVPYRGALEASTALLGGQVDVLVQFASGNVKSYITSGRAKAYAVASPARVEGILDVPTTAEAGLPSLSLEAWYGVFAPAGTPLAIIEKVNKDINKVLQMPDVQARLKSVGMFVETSTPKEFDAFFKSEYARWTNLIKSAGIQAN